MLLGGGRETHTKKPHQTLNFYKFMLSGRNPLICLRKLSKKAVYDIQKNIWGRVLHSFLFYLNNEINLLVNLYLCFVSRISVLASICMAQAFMMWKFINFQLRRWREHSSSQPQSVKKKFVTPKGKTSRKERGLYFQFSCCLDFSKTTLGNGEPFFNIIAKETFYVSLASEMAQLQKQYWWILLWVAFLFVWGFFY